MNWWMFELCLVEIVEIGLGEIGLDWQEREKRERKDFWEQARAEREKSEIGDLRASETKRDPFPFSKRERRKQTKHSKIAVPNTSKTQELHKQPENDTRFEFDSIVWMSLIWNERSPAVLPKRIIVRHHQIERTRFCLWHMMTESPLIIWCRIVCVSISLYQCRAHMFLWQVRYSGLSRQERWLADSLGPESESHSTCTFDSNDIAPLYTIL